MAEGFFQGLKQRFLAWRIKRQKKALRARMHKQLHQMSPRERLKTGNALCERVRSLDAFRQAEVVMLYYPIGTEPDLRPLMEEFKDTKTILLPVAHRTKIEMRRYTGRECLHRGRFGIQEPKGEAFTGEPDLIIVPGVAFDENANRLGRGGGYYDRFLKHFRKAKKYAVAFDCQIVKKIPMDGHDVHIDAVLTVGTEFVRK
ncbi:MAG: 5-formyltetrahydrofolate cyclo-ligase [Paludibacteraceae bacterium]|jgi:5-formyltetrahydrofolate cyclo-ligase|nr:5-formyltetrahydrofolate cyclo-ligase [Lachnospiraceae bacterium]MBP5289875.1 5-formyltetrahydrofolate cyclo-ligase [Paludibacteraceae bacterium]